MAIVWLLIGIGMMSAAFVSKVPSQEYVRLLSEKLLLDKQNKPHDHLNPDSVEQFRPAWKNPLFLFGLGAFVLAGIQLGMAQRGSSRPNLNAPAA